MFNLYFLSQFPNNNLHDVIDVLLNKFSLPLYLYNIDKNASNYALIEIPNEQANRILLESRSGKKVFSLEIRHSPVIETKNDHNLYISKEDHLVRVPLPKNTVILATDQKIKEEMTFKETSCLKKGVFTTEDLVVLSNIDLITYFNNKELFESVDPKKVNELLKKLLSFGRDIDELLKLVELLNPQNEKHSRPLVCAIETWVAMYIYGEENTRHDYLTRSEKVIKRILQDKGYSFSGNVVEQVSLVAKSDDERDKRSVKFDTK